MYKTGKLINGNLYLKTLIGNWISLKKLVQEAGKAL